MATSSHNPEKKKGGSKQPKKPEPKIPAASDTTQCLHCQVVNSRRAVYCSLCGGPIAAACRHPDCNRDPAIKHDPVY